MKKTEKRKGNCMQTYSGKEFWPLDPRPEDVRIEDIAHALSNICRFNGHTKFHYSVAQHSILVSYYLQDKNPELRLVGLLHDAAEAYVCDLIRPIKELIPNYKDVEAGVAHVIGLRYGINLVDLPKEVKHADEVLLATEARDIINKSRAWSLQVEETMPDKIANWTSLGNVKDTFLRCFWEYFENRPSLGIR